MRLMPRTRWGVAWRGLLAGFIVVGVRGRRDRNRWAAAGLECRHRHRRHQGAVHEAHAAGAGAARDAAAGRRRPPLRRGQALRQHRHDDAGADRRAVRRRSTRCRSRAISQVDIPGYGESKLNAAYADGGAHGSNLLVQTLQADVFPHLKVNHIFVTDFSSFAKLISRSAACTSRSITATTTTARLGRSDHGLLEHRHPARLSEAVR